MNKILLLLISLSYCGQVYGQYDNVWAFGHYAGLDFSTVPSTPVKTSINTREGCATICDDKGQLLFYTDGTSVWDRNHNEMPNGRSIVLGGTPYSYTSSTAQGAVIIPAPGNRHQYYIFSLTCMECDVSGRLSYSVVDMRLNNGLGDVLSDKRDIALKNNMTDTWGNNLIETMTAVSGDNCDVWLITVSMVNNIFHVYNITYEGVDTVVVTSPGVPGSHLRMSSQHRGCVDVSPDRKKLAIALDRLVLYDFDPETGKIENPVVLDQGAGSYYGVCFSPDNSKLYTTVPELLQTPFSPLLQFDISSGDSTTMIHSKVSLCDTLTLYSLRRAPDGKIYGTNYYNKEDTGTIVTIHQPNLKGLSSEFDPSPFPLLPTTYAILGLPNIAVITKNKFIGNSAINDSSCAHEIILSPHDTSGINYVWNDSIPGLKFRADTSGTYWVSYQLISDVCREVVDSFRVYFKHLSTGLAIRPECKGDGNGNVHHILDAGDNNRYSYQWHTAYDTATLSTDSFLSGIRAGDYRVYIRSSNGCDTTLYFHVPEMDFHVNFDADSLLCAGDTMVFRNTSDSHFDYWEWDFGDGGTSEQQSPVYSFTESGAYRVRLVGKGPVCTDTAYRMVEVDAPARDLRFTADRDEICKGESIHLSVLSDVPYVRLAWQLGGSSQLSVDEDELRHAFDREGAVGIALTAHFRICPPLTYTDSVIVHPLPVVDLGSGQALCLNGTPILLYNKRALPTGDYAYLWNTGDTTAQLKVTHPGVYTLRVDSRPLGCSASESVEVKKDCYIDIPNAFTPNDDGENDHFFPRQLLSKSVTGFSMKVFNRWGQVVFETDSVQGRGWDGKFNGKEQPVGVYVYRIEVELDGERNEKYEGNVTLLR